MVIGLINPLSGTGSYVMFNYRYCIILMVGESLTITSHKWDSDSFEVTCDIDIGTFNITNLLIYSAVCGIGLDTIPLPGNVSERKINSLLIDIASLSNKLNKPLSARLMPIPNKKRGDMTDFTFNYFVNSRLMDV